MSLFLRSVVVKHFTRKAFGMAIAFIVLSCDMFSPRPVQVPQVQGVFIDPLSLSGIMNYTNQQFSKTAYEDILHPDFLFTGYNGMSFDQNEEVARFKAIIVDSTVRVTWDTCQGNIQEAPDTIIVCRNFKAVYRITSSDSLVDSGRAQLRLEKYSPKNTWTIRSWLEIGTISIFNPDFKQYH